MIITATAIAMTIIYRDNYHHNGYLPQWSLTGEPSTTMVIYNVAHETGKWWLPLGWKITENNYPEPKGTEGDIQERHMHL